MKKILIFTLSLLMIISTFTLLSSCGGSKAGAVSLELNGGTLTEAFDGNFTVGDTIDLPIPVKELGYFGGWYTDAEFKNRVDEKFTPEKGGLIKLYAKFSTQIELEYNNLEGCEIANPESFTKAYAPGVESLILPDVSKDGYEFGGWYKDRDLTQAVSYSDIAALTYSQRLYAKWYRDVVFTWNFNGGVESGEKTESFTYVLGFDIPEIKIPTVTKADEDFVGWFTDAEMTKPVTVEAIKSITESTTFYARFGTINFPKLYDEIGTNFLGSPSLVEDETSLDTAPEVREGDGYVDYIANQHVDWMLLNTDMVFSTDGGATIGEKVMAMKNQNLRPIIKLTMNLGRINELPALGLYVYSGGNTMEILFRINSRVMSDAQGNWIGDNKCIITQKWANEVAIGNLSNEGLTEVVLYFDFSNVTEENYLVEGKHLDVIVSGTSIDGELHEATIKFDPTATTLIDIYRGQTYGGPTADSKDTIFPAGLRVGEVKCEWIDEESMKNPK